MTDVQRLLDALTSGGVEFVAVGGVWDERTLASGLNFTLTTDLGDLDILGEIPGVGDYAQVAAGSSELVIGNSRVRVLDLDALERAQPGGRTRQGSPRSGAITEIRRRSPS